MITSLHTMIYSDDAEATRVFFRDVLQWPYVSMDDDWLIFKTGLSEMGVHPTFSVWEGKEYRHPRHHAVYLMCDDLQATIQELQTRGAEFDGEPVDQGYGIVISMKVPGADNIELYQPAHPTAFNL